MQPKKKKEGKKLLACVAVPPASVGIPSLAPSVTRITSVANDKGDDEMMPGPVHRSPGICLTPEENLGKILSWTSTKAVRPSHPGIPYLQLRSVGAHSTPEKEKDGYFSTIREQHLKGTTFH